MSKKQSNEFLQGKIREFYDWGSPLKRWLSASDIEEELGVPHSHPNVCIIGKTVLDLNGGYGVLTKGRRQLKVPRKTSEIPPE